MRAPDVSGDVEDLTRCSICHPERAVGLQGQDSLFHAIHQRFEVRLVPLQRPCVRSNRAGELIQGVADLLE